MKAAYQILRYASIFSVYHSLKYSEHCYIHAINTNMIELQLDSWLGDRSLYWLAKQSGVAYSTIHKLKKTQPQGISFDVLSKLCDALECAPGDLLLKVPDTTRKNARRKQSAHRPKPAEVSERRIKTK